jgi:hypothetical protein
MASTNDKTQKEMVLRSIKRAYTTSHDALMNLGVARLASRINDLRNDGHPIKTKWVEVTARNGKTVQVKAYKYDRRVVIDMPTLNIGGI